MPDAPRRRIVIPRPAAEDIALYPWELQGDAFKLKNDKPAAAKPKMVKALPNGRMKNVKLGDILKAYERTKVANGYYRIVDFRPPKFGEFYLDKAFVITKMKLNKQTTALRLVLELVEVD